MCTVDILDEVIDVGYERSSDVLWLSNVQCNGRETHLVNCTRSLLGVKRSQCGGFAGVSCRSERKCNN